MVSKTTSFKNGKGKKGYFMKRQITLVENGPLVPVHKGLLSRFLNRD